MRAYLSPTFTREGAVGPRDVAIFADVARVPVHPLTASAWGREALVEAQMITAAAGEVDTWILPGDRASETGPERMARRILVDALSAFVELEVRA